MRHNGGCAWFDELGQPWPKHGCMQVGRPDQSLTANFTAFPDTDTKGKVILVWAADGSSAHILVQWENGLLAAYAIAPGVLNRRLMLHSPVSYRTISHPHLTGPDGRQLLIDPVTVSRTPQPTLREIQRAVDVAAHGVPRLVDPHGDVTVWIGNLSGDRVRERQLRAALSNVGVKVVSIRIRDHIMYAYAFVQVASKAERSRLIEQVKELNVGGRICPIRAAKRSP